MALCQLAHLGRPAVHRVAAGPRRCIGGLLLRGPGAPLTVSTCSLLGNPAVAPTRTAARGQVQQHLRGLVLLSADLPRPWERVCRLAFGPRLGGAASHHIYLEVQGRCAHVACFLLAGAGRALTSRRACAQEQQPGADARGGRPDPGLGPAGRQPHVLHAAGPGAHRLGCAAPVSGLPAKCMQRGRKCMLTAPGLGEQGELRAGGQAVRVAAEAAHAAAAQPAAERRSLAPRTERR